MANRAELRVREAREEASLDRPRPIWLEKASVPINLKNKLRAFYFCFSFRVIFRFIISQA
jgi:hypothetical protein